MTYAAQNRHFTPYFAYQASPKSNAVAKKPGVLRRIFDAIVESRQKHADREIALCRPVGRALHRQYRARNNEGSFDG